VGERTGDPRRLDPETGKPESIKSSYLRLLVSPAEAAQAAARRGNGSEDAGFVALAPQRPQASLDFGDPVDSFEDDLSAAEEAAGANTGEGDRGP